MALEALQKLVGDVNDQTLARLEVPETPADQLGLSPGAVADALLEPSATVAATPDMGAPAQLDLAIPGIVIDPTGPKDAS